MHKIQKDDAIFVAGHRGMVGSAVVRNLHRNGYTHVLTASRTELDLSNQSATRAWIAAHKPKVVVIAAAKVGGILANSTYPWDFIYDNLLIETNLIGACHENDVQNVIFLGSSCIYPKFAEQPISEESLLTAPLEPTNEWYAIAKIAGVKMIEALRKQHGRNYVSLMPTNLYGPNDNFDLKNSHVLPAMLRKFHTASPDGNVELWGSGTPMREFLHVDDMAEAVRHAMEHPLNESLYNVGTGSDITIRDLAGVIAEVTGFKGQVHWDGTKPDGTPRKLLNVSRLAAEGWSAKISLEDGIRDTYRWFIEHLENDTIRS
jgi:GDP-L-fucose synthase